MANKLTRGGSGVEYFVIEEYTHPRVGSPSFDDYHTYSSLEKAAEVLKQFPIEEGEGRSRSGNGYEYEWTTTAHLTQRLTSVPSSTNSKGVYFAVCSSFRGEESRVTKHNSFSSADEVVKRWQKKEPLGDACVTQKIDVKVSYKVETEE